MYYIYNDIKIYYEKYYTTSDKNILILPGWGDTRNTFKYMINFLKDKYNIYIVDYPSFGNSPIPNKDLTIYDYEILIKNFIKYLNIKNIIIIAHSFGGRITSILANEKNIDIKKIILIDTAGIKRKKTMLYIKTKIYKLLKYICIKLFKNKKEKKLRMLNSFFGSNDYNNLNINMKKTFINIVKDDLRSYYKKINVNTLILWGKKDKETPYKDAKYLNRNIKNSELIVFNNGTHFIYLEFIYQINLIINSFIEEK